MGETVDCLRSKEVTVPVIHFKAVVLAFAPRFATLSAETRAGAKNVTANVLISRKQHMMRVSCVAVIIRYLGKFEVGGASFRGTSPHFYWG